MGLADWFRSFYSNIRVQDGGTISNRYRAITRRLSCVSAPHGLLEHYVGNVTQSLRGVLRAQYSYRRF